MSNIQNTLESIKNNIRVIPTTPKTCKICNDKKVITKIGENGLLEIVGECECVKKEYYKKIIENSGLKEKLKECTFDTFDDYTPALKYTKTIAKRFVTDESAEVLLLLGKSGTGKTHLATAVCGELLNKYSKPIRYARYREMVQELKALTLDLEGRREVMDRYKLIRYLYIDDLFKNMDHRYETEKQLIFEILDYRYSKHLKTIITSEYTMNQLLDTDEAMAGRLGERAEGYIVNFSKTKNYRKLKMEKDREKLYGEVMGV